MRTTIDIRDEVLEKVRNYAKARSISNGEAASDILERGFTATVPTKWENGILIFVPGSEGVVTLEHTLRLEDELEDELF
jgi:hypothetical protein